MIIGIISDSHDSIENLTKALDIMKSKNVEFVIHLGDIVSPFAANTLNIFEGNYCGVFGNNDGEIEGIKKVTKGKFYKPPFLLKLEDKKLVLMHEGDIAELIDDSIDFVLYGHSHNFDVKYKGKQMILNPGTISGYMSDKSSFIILDTNSKEYSLIEI